MNINWNEFEKLIGNRKRKYVLRNGQKYLFISYNDETKEVTVKHTLSDRKLIVMPLKHFIEDFSFQKMTNELPIF